MASGKPFSLLKRGKYWYCRFKLPDGRYSTAKSTKETSKHRAEAWAVNYIQQGRIVTREGVTFEQVARGFFDWSGPWATDKKARGLRLGERWCLELDRITTNSLIPFFGPLKLTAITAHTIRDFRNKIFTEGRSGSFINKTLIALKAILTDAAERDLIQFVPKVEKAGLGHVKAKGCLTVDEVRRLFAAEWPDYRCYVANLLSAGTGLRLSEIMAVTLDDVDFQEGLVRVHRAWDCKLHRLNEATKSGRARLVPIGAPIQERLARLADMNLHRASKGGAAFLFFDVNDPERPIADTRLMRSFYEAMREIGISEDERRRRALSFHSHRVFFTSFSINSRIPAETVRAVAGHLSGERMTQLYYRPDEMRELREIQTQLLPPGEIGPGALN